MIEILTRWWFAHKVCRKYNTFFIPILSSSFEGKVNYNGEGRYLYVRVSLFNPCFWEIFFHEIGHVVSSRVSKNYSVKTFYDKNITWIEGRYKDTPYYLTLIEEATASRHAIRLLKKFNRYNESSFPILWQAISTYVKMIPVSCKVGRLNKLLLADTDYSLAKYIRN